LEFVLALAIAKTVLFGAIRRNKRKTLIVALLLAAILIGVAGAAVYSSMFMRNTVGVEN